MLDIGGTRHTVHQRGDIRGPADLVDLARSAELLLERHEIDRIVALGELDHLLEDAPVRIAEEVVGVDHFRGEIERVVVEQDGAEHGALRLEIVRQRTFSDCVRQGSTANLDSEVRSEK